MTRHREARNYIFCGNFIKEVQALESTFDEDDQITYFTGNCEIQEKKCINSNEFFRSDMDNHVFCTACFSNINDHDKIFFHREEQGLHLIAPPELVNDLQASGAYLVGSGWLSDWNRHLESLGFDQNDGKSFWKESVTEFIHLDAGVLPDASLRLKELGEYTSRPTRSLPIGLDYLRTKIKNLLTSLELEDLKKELLRNERKHRAETSMTFDIISQLTKTSEEKKVIQCVLDIFCMLFAPGRLVYWNRRDGKFDPPAVMHGASAWTYPPKKDWKGGEGNEVDADGKGFSLRIGNENDFFALIEVGKFTNTEKVGAYFDLARYLANSISMAIDNARKVSEIKINELLLRRDRNALHDRNEQLKNLNEQIQTMVGYVSHDLRSPISSALNILNLYEPEEIDQEVVEDMTQALDQCLTLSNDLLDMSAIESGKISIDKKWFFPEPLLQEVFKDYSQRAEKKGVTIKLELEGDEREIYGDGARIKQVIVNFISNALKFTPRGGEIIIDLKLEREGAWLSVVDGGYGVPENIIDDLFRKDRKTSRSGTEGEKGTGFGLPLSYELVQLHGGKIEVKNMTDKGAKFSCWVPDEGKGVTVGVVKEYSRGVKVLLVEDDVFCQNQVQEVLLEEDYEIQICFDLEESKKYLKESAYDLILLDLNLPDGHGEELLKWIRSGEGLKTENDTAVVLITCGGATESCCELGLQGMVRKPFNNTDLLSVVNDLKLREVYDHR
jgi:signal transduction histidine kinase/ActR/RegA family two-component response regulator